MEIEIAGEAVGRLLFEVRCHFHTKYRTRSCIFTVFTSDVISSKPPLCGEVTDVLKTHCLPSSSAVLRCLSKDIKEL